MVREPVSKDELQLAKDQATSSVLLSLESSGARVGALARQEIIHGRRISPDQIIKSIEMVTSEDVQRVAQSCFTTSSLAVGAQHYGAHEVVRAGGFHVKSNLT